MGGWHEGLVAIGDRGRGKSRPIDLRRQLASRSGAHADAISARDITYYAGPDCGLGHKGSVALAGADGPIR